MPGTTVAYVLKRWADRVGDLEGVRVLFSPTLSIEEAPHRLRRLQVRTSLEPGQPLVTGGEPAILFTRRPLTRGDNTLTRHSLKVHVDSRLYKGIYGVLEMEGLFVTKDWKRLEEFEVKYLTRAGISGEKQLEVDFGDPLGIQTYQISWGDLSAVDIGTGVDALGLAWTCRISGWWFWGEMPVSVIREIDLFYRNYTTGTVLWSDVIAE